MYIHSYGILKVALYLLLLFDAFNYVMCSIYKNLKHFETLHASQFSHSIVKRGIKHSDHPFNKIREVTFSTLGRDFRLILTPKKGILHPKFKASVVDGDGQEKPVFVDHDNFYDGRLFGELSSEASVHLEDGVMTATIHAPEDIYHIEPSWRHLPHLDNQSMIAYRESDIHFSWSHGEGQGGTDTWPHICGYVKEGEDEGPEGNEDDGDTKVRNKRQAEQYGYTPTKTRCPLLLVADYRFYQQMGRNSTKTTINYLISLIDRVHKMYSDTTWQAEKGKVFTGMGFVIKKIVVHSESTKVRHGEAHYNMVRERWDARHLLEIFSLESSHKDFCLAHLFTDFKFEGGVLGLAYVGGICTAEDKNGYSPYKNSGLSSSRNHYGQRVITREADLVTAHEFGHNWGSEHDPDTSECSPSASRGGSYLMYTYSVSGYDRNNKHFSPCSVKSIHALLEDRSERCFSEPEEFFCGNLRVEGDEECDAGLLGTEDNDACCDKNCKLRRNQGAVCSDRNSLCCQNCQFMAGQMKCRDAQPATCEQESHCTGASSECPHSLPMTDGTPCLEKGQCRGGECIPYCETQHRESCMCDNITDACKRCCRLNQNDTCFPVDPQDILPDGTPCMQGFCNKNVCEKTVQDVVERLWDIIKDININRVTVFLRDNIVCTVILVTAIIWIPASCAISCVDRRRRNAQEKSAKWMNSNEIYRDDSGHLINTNVPQQRPPTAAVLQDLDNRKQT